MAQPHDLVQFMKQEDRVFKAKFAQADIDVQKSIINQHEKKDDPKIEEKLMESDPDCMTAEKPLSQHDLFTSSALTLENFGIETDSLLGIPRKLCDGEQPFCSQFYDLPFSMAALEHLPFPDVWWLHNIAILYWRIMGNASEAIECSRRALHLAPREFTVLPLLNLASVLHHGSRSKDAAQVLDVVFSLNESLPSAHCLAADVYAVAIQYNKSLLSFDECIRMDPTYPGVYVRQAAVRCHQKLEKALESQHENLQRTLTELQSYQNRLKTYQDLHQQTYHNVVDQEAKRQMSLSYDYFVYAPVNYLNCKMTKDNLVKYLNCAVDDDSKYLAARKKRHYLLFEQRKRQMNATEPTKASVASSDTMGETSAVDFDKEKAFLDALEPLRSVSLDQPTLPKKYPVKNTKVWSTSDFVFQSASWPSEEECKINSEPVPSHRDVPHIFLSPKNKGFELDVLLTKYLNLGDGEEHPLPWYPPFCSALVTTQAKLDLPCCDHLLGVQRAKKRSRDQLVAESQLKDTFLALTNSPLETEAEMGQRIHTLLKYEIGPRWLLLNLAALYWRVVGISAEAVTCLRLALSEDSGKKYADVALIQLSQLTSLAGDRLDDGIVLVKQAIQIDSTEPVSHYLLGYFLALKGNYSGASQHLNKALHLDPKFPGALSALKSIRCHVKLPSCVAPPPLAPILLPVLDSAEKFCYFPNGPPKVSGKTTNKKKPMESSKCSQGKREKCTGSEQMEEKEPMGMIPSSEEAQEDEVTLDADNVKKATGRDINTPPPTVRPPPSQRTVRYDLGDEEENETLEEGSTRVVEKETRQTPTTEKLSSIEPTNDREENMEIKKDTADDFESSSLDSLLPEILPTPFPSQIRSGARLMSPLPTSSAECAQLKKYVRLDQPTSTWLSVTAKGVKLDHFVNFVTDPKGYLEPFCPEIPGPTMWTLDHLHGFRLDEAAAQYKPEKGLKDAFQNLGNKKDTLQRMATRLALAMENFKMYTNVPLKYDGSVHWSLTTVAALYWRVQGNLPMSVRCLRHSLNNAPAQMRDLALVSLANIYHQAGLLHSALIAAGAALQISPKFVVIHFTLANIYSTMGDLDHAMMFYYSTLALQNNFDPARERIKAIYCITGRIPIEAQNIDD